MTDRELIVETARSWIGVRWRHQGRSRDGIDCAGLLIMICRELGLSDYDSYAYSRRPTDGKFLHNFTEAGATPIRVGQHQPGDILVFREGRYPCHCGVASMRHGQPAVIHAAAGRGRVVEEPLGQVAALAPLVAAYGFPSRPQGPPIDDRAVVSQPAGTSPASGADRPLAARLAAAGEV